MLPIFTLIIQIIFIGFFGWAAYAKLTKQQHMVKEFEGFQLPYWMAQIAGLTEIVIVSCLIAGFVVPELLFAGFGLLVPTMIGAALINFWKRPVQFGVGVVIIFLLPAAVLAHHTFMTHIALSM